MRKFGGRNSKKRRPSASESPSASKKSTRKFAARPLAPLSPREISPGEIREKNDSERSSGRRSSPLTPVSLPPLSFLSRSFFFLTEKRHYDRDLPGNLRSAETVASPYPISRLIRHGSRNFIAGNISYVSRAHPGNGNCFRANLDSLLVLLRAWIGGIFARDRCIFELGFRARSLPGSLFNPCYICNRFNVIDSCRI